MESFSNPIFQGIDSNETSPIKISQDLHNQKALDSQLQTQLQQELLKFQGLEQGLETYSYEDLKIEVLQLKNNLLTFQSKFERQITTNNQNFSTIDQLKQELTKKSNEIQKLSAENVKTKTQVSELLKHSESVIKSSEPQKQDYMRFSSALETKSTVSDSLLQNKLKSLEMREKTLGSELLKGYEEKRLLEEKVKSLQKEINEFTQRESISSQNKVGDRSKLFDIEKRSLLKEIGDLKTTNLKLEESVNNERENTKKKDSLIEKLSIEKAKLLKDMNKSYEENNQFIAQIEQENQNHLMILQQFQSKTSNYETRIADLEKTNKTQIVEIKGLNQKNEALNEELKKISPLELEVGSLRESNRKNDGVLKESQERTVKLMNELTGKEKVIQEKDLLFNKEKNMLEQKIANLENLYKGQCEHSSVISKNVDIISEEMRTLKKK